MDFFYPKEKVKGVLKKQWKLMLGALLGCLFLGSILSWELYKNMEVQEQSKVICSTIVFEGDDDTEIAQDNMEILYTSIHFKTLINSELENQGIEQLTDSDVMLCTESGKTVNLYIQSRKDDEELENIMQIVAELFINESFNFYGYDCEVLENCAIKEKSYLSDGQVIAVSKDYTKLKEFIIIIGACYCMMFLLLLYMDKSIYSVDELQKLDLECICCDITKRNTFYNEFIKSQKEKIVGITIKELDVEEKTKLKAVDEFVCWFNTSIVNYDNSVCFFLIIKRGEVTLEQIREITQILKLKDIKIVAAGIV